MSNSQLGYELLPAWREQLPGVRFIDYLVRRASRRLTDVISTTKPTTAGRRVATPALAWRRDATLTAR